ncbi:putative pantetheine hydrolase [Brevibacterium siliguriense]|uniref:Putative pantetheine hydrolase n=1 Tax=Brevibacterium siliguriense TaxID=1136497 RepID=A0A1H1VAD6_9MICO|nr:P1 family peptidase [Brevibacterium siliguriense]SDS81718.1 putative pantetheine hydrolase [Brevibacterium siliguriense]
MPSDSADRSGPGARFGPVRGRGILEIPGIRLGHAGELTESRLTGISTVLPPAGSSIGVDVRGGGPATRETDVIAPGTHSYGADAICLTGGSAFGLGAVSGVVDTLAEAGLGFPAPGVDGAVIPLAPSAAIFDLGRGDGSVAPPTPDEGAQATRAALSGRTTEVRGSVGAGTGARSGFQSLRGGLGSFAVRLPSGSTVAALVAANSLGTIGTPAGGLWLAPLLRSVGFDLPTVHGLPTAPPADSGTAAKNTTIAIVATDARLDPAQTTRMASGAHAGIARAVRPSHTLFDGDTVFGIATGAKELPADRDTATRELVMIAAAAADALSLAILDAHASATPVDDAWGQPPTLSEIAPDFTSAFTGLR